MSANNISQEEFPSWRAIEDTGAGDGLPTECERCGKSGTPRQQFQHMGVTICFVCADERVAELGSEGSWPLVRVRRSLDVLAEGAIDVRLVSTSAGLGLEPCNDVCVDSQRNLLLHRPIEDSAPGVGPVDNFRGVGRVDLVVGQSFQRPNLRLNVWR